MRQNRNLIIFLIVFGFVLSACQPNEDPAIGDYSYGQNALVDSLEVVLLESFPLQAQAVVRGNLPDGCTELHEITVEKVGNQFNLLLQTRRPTGDVSCIQALVPFEESVDLDIEGLEAGAYTVAAQDQEATFKLDVDNTLEDLDDGIEYDYGDTAMIDGITVDILESFPVQVAVTIEGNLPDGCTEIDDILTRIEGDTFFIEIITRKSAGDIACTMALVPFEKRVPLNVEGLKAGLYTIIAGDQESTFTLAVDNVLPDDDMEEKSEYGQSARLEEMYVNVMESFPVQVSVSLKGYLPDGCTRIHDITATREGGVFKVQIITRRPTGDIACTMAIVHFEETVKLDVEGLSAGTYQVVAGEFTETFTLDVDNAYT